MPDKPFPFRETDKPVQRRRDIPSTTLATKRLSITEALSILPIQIRLPKYVPEGYVLRDSVLFTPQQNDLMRFSTLIFSWVNAGSSTGQALDRLESAESNAEPIVQLPKDTTILYLEIEHPYTPERPQRLVAEGSVEEVQIRGDPAALVRGAWGQVNGQKQWTSGAFTLSWIHQGSVYEISSTGNFLKAEELINIAESIE